MKHHSSIDGSTGTVLDYSSPPYVVSTYSKAGFSPKWAKSSQGINSLLCSGTNHRPSTRHLRDNVAQILAIHHLANVAQVERRRALLNRLAHVVQREPLVVRHSVHLGLVQEAGPVHGAVVEGRDHHFVLVRDARVAHVDESVGRAGEKEVRVGGVEGELGYVVAVDFVVVDFGDAGGAEIPFCWKLVRFLSGRRCRTAGELSLGT